MPVPLGNSSRLKLATCQPELRRLAEAVAAGVDAGECPGVHDMTVLCGFRGEKDQDEAFAKGTSTLQWPHSKHNHLPALAVDMAPFPLNYPLWEKDKTQLEAFRAYVLSVAARLGIKLRIISWDWPHFELAS
jgi:peptidoglycan L-alanyl-D-glutamate endopeptidase CwlK